MDQIEFEIYGLKPLNKVFIVPPDDSSWDNEPRYVKRGQNCVPNRQHSIEAGDFLQPLNENVMSFFDKRSDSNYGIYILIFPDFKRFYVGVAARFSRLVRSNSMPISNPEGIFQRLCKHRAKCTGSYSTINHTDANGRGWRTLAIERYLYHKSHGIPDTMSDCLLSIINFQDHTEHKIDDKGSLEKLENWLSTSNLTPIFGDQYLYFDPLARTTKKQIDFEPNFRERDFEF